jgi:2-oxoacid:acceptor oxidoreductase delta subunit (pyruvate/2-ketoisovalerate family)
MAVAKEEKYIYETEASWSDGNKPLLCLKTGEWRTERPILSTEKCNACGICVVYCPTQCFVDDGDYYGVNLEYCKGCGICAKECPKKAITMTPEGEYADECPIQE